MNFIGTSIIPSLSPYTTLPRPVPAGGAAVPFDAGGIVPLGGFGVTAGFDVAELVGDIDEDGVGVAVLVAVVLGEDDGNDVRIGDDDADVLEEDVGDAVVVADNVVVLLGDDDGI